MFKPMFVVLISLIANACSSQNISLSILYQSNQCGITEEGLNLILQQQEVERLAARNNRFVLEETDTVIPQADLDNKNVVLVSAGTKNSAGYSFSLLSQTVKSSNNRIQLPVELNTPESSQIVAQILTTPCIILEIDKSNYSSLSYLNYVINLP